MRRGISRLRVARLVLAVFVLAAYRPAWAVPDDVPGWGPARWGMTGPELKQALGDTVAPLPSRWLYGGAYAELIVPKVNLDGLRFSAYLQMDRSSDRLRQVLMERRRVGATPAVFERLINRLEQDYGPASQTCSQAKRGGEPLDYQLIWRFPTTTIHVKFLDFSTTSVFTRDPQTDIDPLTPERDIRRNTKRFFPRRILLRFHDTRERHLDRGCS